MVSQMFRVYMVQDCLCKLFQKTHTNLLRAFAMSNLKYPFQKMLPWNSDPLLIYSIFKLIAEPGLMQHFWHLIYIYTVSSSITFKIFRANTEFCSQWKCTSSPFEEKSNGTLTHTLQPLYNTVCYNTVLDITQFKDWSQKCIDYIEKWP